jgi:hypothetical protein
MLSGSASSMSFIVDILSPSLSLVGDLPDCDLVLVGSEGVEQEVGFNDITQLSEGDLIITAQRELD